MNRLLGRTGRAAAAVAVGAVMLGPPAQATDTVGGGALAGTVTYTSGSIAPWAGTCGPATWRIDALSAATVVDTATPYAGPVTVTAELETAWGANGCDSVVANGGGGTMSMHGTNPAGTSFHCTSDPASGTFVAYVRWGTNIVLAGSLACAVNSTPIGVLDVIGDFQLVPTTPGGGITVPVTTAALTGPFVLLN